MSLSVDAVGTLLCDWRPSAGPFLIGVTGSVAAGKSTFALQLAEALAGWVDRPVPEVVSTDGFLLPNAKLETQGLSLRKGYPETYDMAALRAALKDVRTGDAAFPGYSHMTYDVDPSLERRLRRPDVLIVEGLALHEGAGALGLDVLIYLDADVADLEAWFVDRFMQFWTAAEFDPASFYVRFRHLSEAEARGVAQAVWRAVNLPNLERHIAFGRSRADIVVRKQSDHSIGAIIRQHPGPEGR